MKRLLCRIIGHHLDYEFGDHCYRCGRDFVMADDPVRSDDAFWLRWYRLTHWPRHLILYPVRRWLRCEWCGGRFGRHDKDSCIPF